MKEITLPVTEFKAKCLRLLDDVEKKGDRIVISRQRRAETQERKLIHRICTTSPTMET